MAIIPDTTASALDSIQAIIQDNNRLKAQLEQVKKINEDLRQDIAETKTKYEKLKNFEDIAESTIQYLTVYLRDKPTIDKLRGRAVQLFGKGADIESNDDTVRKAAARRIDGIVEHCVWYVVNYKWHEVAPKLKEKVGII